MTEDAGSDLSALGLEEDEDAENFGMTANETITGVALGLAGLAAVVVIGTAAVVGVQAISWIWPYLLLGLTGG